MVVQTQAVTQTKKDILALIRPDMARLNDVVRTTLHSEVPLVNQVAEYLINAGGKRLRPAIHLLLTRALQKTCPDTAYTLAAVVEFIHTSTLLHDDVVDESDLRRGRQTANALFGNAASVLVGDFLYSRSFQMMVSVQSMRVMEILADATNVIAEGEVLQLLNVHDPDVTEARYMQVIHYKTARLFEASAQLSAVMSACTPEQEKACAAYGRHLGAAFQLADDILDYAGDTAVLGKNVGDDLREGKPTLPLIYVLEHGSDTEKAMVRAAIENGGIDQTHPDFNAVLTAITAGGALAYTRQLAQREVTAAKEALAFLPESEYKQVLLDLADYALAREV
ncbi:MAG: octaprenyl diphosphate synthase [Burkholderiales bacterium]|nr:octaprenyl diphosphate synthase [Burkholderiales bacterium]